MKVLLTDTHWRTSYYVCKSLSKRGIEVVGLKYRDTIFDKTRYYKQIINVPSLEDEPDLWLEEVMKLKISHAALIPISIESLKLVASKKKILKDKFIVPDISIDQLNMANDKQKAINFMRELGIRVPETIMPESLEEAEKLITKFDFPIVVKLREEKNLSPVERYGIAHNKDQFIELYKNLSLLQPYPLIQEYVQGQGVGISLLSQKGNIIAMSSHQRLREQFLTGGPSTYCSVFDSSILKEWAIKFTQASCWNGIAMLEFKYDRSNDTFYFMEVNPRFWGTVELAIRNNIDFPYLYFKWLNSDINDSIVHTSDKLLKLKFISDDICAFTNSILDLDKNKRRKLLYNYVQEYTDPQLSYMFLDLQDHKIIGEEVKRIIIQLLRLAKYTL
ncbi:MAG: ATP-grasp enzyme-like protein [uncultured bacterium]|nr:MAG: ATP-grasp enzyme-like protein [uncultured bacterium]HBH18733.1 hypothetical protein [Cyanobacteria bacterium UBA9579]